MLSRTRAHEWLIVIASLALFLEVPPIVYGYLSYQQFEYFKVTGYMPYEELMIALRSGSLGKILGAPLVSLNMTSGHLFSNVYAFTIGPLVASLILGTFTGLIIVAQLRIQLTGGATSSGSAWSILGLGLLAPRRVWYVGGNPGNYRPERGYSRAASVALPLCSSCSHCRAQRILHSSAAEVAAGLGPVCGIV